MLERHFSNKPLRNDRSAAGIAERESFSLKMLSVVAIVWVLFSSLNKEFHFCASKGEKREFEINFTK